MKKPEPASVEFMAKAMLHHRTNMELYAIASEAKKLSRGELDDYAKASLICYRDEVVAVFLGEVLEAVRDLRDEMTTDEILIYLGKAVHKNLEKSSSLLVTLHEHVRKSHLEEICNKAVRHPDAKSSSK